MSHAKSSFSIKWNKFDFFFKRGKTGQYRNIVGMGETSV